VRVGRNRLGRAPAGERVGWLGLQRSPRWERPACPWCTEVCSQLRGEAGPRTAKSKAAALGLIENGGGVMGFDEAACAVTILEKNT